VINLHQINLNYFQLHELDDVDHFEFQFQHIDLKHVLKVVVEMKIVVVVVEIEVVAVDEK